MQWFSGLRKLGNLNNQMISRIGSGLLVPLGVSEADDSGDAEYLSEKILHLRIFEDESRKNEPLSDGNSWRDAGGIAVYAVGGLSQGSAAFLCASSRTWKRPSISMKFLSNRSEIKVLP